MGRIVRAILGAGLIISLSACGTQRVVDNHTEPEDTTMAWAYVPPAQKRSQSQKAALTAVLSRQPADAMISETEAPEATSSPDSPVERLTAAEAKARGIIQERRKTPGPVLAHLPEMIISDRIATDGKADNIQRYHFTSAFDLANHISFEPARFSVNADAIGENPFQSAKDNPLSTFSLDVDTASYSRLRHAINKKRTFPRSAVRIEELINYFPYDYPQPNDGKPFGVTAEVAECPWEPAHRLVKIGIKAREIQREQRPPCNLVFLVDVSGSMADDMPLVQDSLRLIVDKLNSNDRVAIVTYAGFDAVALPSTFGNDKVTIEAAIDSLAGEGSTNGGAGITRAYDIAANYFIPNGVNRVFLCTDGDFNVGVTSTDELVGMVETRRDDGVYLTVLGYGVGRFNDAMLEQVTGKGNGTYAYIDSLTEANKVLTGQIESTIVTVAKDVKLQAEFNPAEVESYRLIGYENRMMANEDFHDDRKDAGEIGAGHTVTALYEINPVNDENTDASGELLTLRVRYKEPQSHVSRLMEFPVRDDGRTLSQASDDFLFAASVASWGLLLRQSQFKGLSSHETALTLAEVGLNNDPHGYRAEYIDLLIKAQAAQK